MVMKLAYQPAAEANTIAAGEFKAKCLRLMDQALEAQQPLTVTKRGVVIGQFVPKPVEATPFRSIVGRSPGIRLPSEKQWKEHKAVMAADWELSVKNAALSFQPKRKKGRKGE